jgi:hypothetical protein
MFCLILAVFCTTTEPDIQELYKQCVRTSREKELIDLDVAAVRLEKMSKLPVKNKQQLQMRASLRHQADYIRKYARKLKAGKILPTLPKLDPFKLKPNTIGTIGRTREDVSVMLRVVERVNGGILVRAEKTQRVRNPEHQSSGGTIRMQDYGSSIQQALSSGYRTKVRGSSFFVEGVDGEPKDEISLPGAWLVLPGPTAKQMRLRQVPDSIHSPPTKPMLHPLSQYR